MNYIDWLMAVLERETELAKIILACEKKFCLLTAGERGGVSVI